MPVLTFVQCQSPVAVHWYVARLVRMRLQSPVGGLLGPPRWRGGGQCVLELFVGVREHVTRCGVRVFVLRNQTVTGEDGACVSCGHVLCVCVCCAQGVVVAGTAGSNPSHYHVN